GFVASPSIAPTRLWVATLRESMIFRLAASVQRWSIFSPARLTTPSTPAKASAGGRSSVGSQACQAICGAAARAFSGLRVSPTTSSPRFRSSSQSALPILPLAPVTRIFIRFCLPASGRLYRGEGAGLLVEAGDAVALGLLDHRFGDLRRDFAVEDGGDDVVLGEVVLGHRGGDAFGG